MINQYYLFMEEIYGVSFLLKYHFIQVEYLYIDIIFIHTKYHIIEYNHFIQTEYHLY